MFPFYLIIESKYGNWKGQNISLRFIPLNNRDKVLNPKFKSHREAEGAERENRNHPQSKIQNPKSKTRKRSKVQNRSKDRDPKTRRAKSETVLVNKFRQRQVKNRKN